MGENADLWDSMHEIRDRVTRIEERSVSRDEKIAAMAGKVDEMHKFFLQSQGGFKAASVMTRFAYGAGGVLFTLIAANWQAFKRMF
jgi:hypothetical protein